MHLFHDVLCVAHLTHINSFTQLYWGFWPVFSDISSSQRLQGLSNLFCSSTIRAPLQRQQSSDCCWEISAQELESLTLFAITNTAPSNENSLETILQHLPVGYSFAGDSSKKTFGIGALPFSSGYSWWCIREKEILQNALAKKWSGQTPKCHWIG